MYPNLNEEKILWKKGFKCVVGLDEVGIGPLAGPVVAAAVLVKCNAKIFAKNFGVRDSKKFSAMQREKLYKVLTNHKDIEWGIGIVSEKIIDKINILEATKLAMVKAAKDIGIKEIDFLILDGNFKIDTSRLRQGFGEPKQKSVIKGDEKIFSCAAASIIAKVTRDNLMEKYDKKYPNYGFKKHKGYPTKAHFTSLEEFGPCPIHRKSFYPISQHKLSTS